MQDYVLSLLNWLQQNLATVLFGILAAILAVILYLRARKEKEPVWAGYTRLLLGKGSAAPPELKLYFAGKEVDQVSESYLLFWNKGRETIRGEDLVSNPVLLFNPPVRLLRQPEVISKSREAIGFQLTESNGLVNFAFKFLDKGDGALIRVLHDGSPPTYLNVSATIMGCPKGLKLAGVISFGPPQPVIRSVGNLCSAILFAVFPIVFGVLLYTKGEFTIGIAIFCFFFFALGVFASYLEVVGFFAYRKFPKWSRARGN